jgi:hypothetical protein
MPKLGAGCSGERFPYQFFQCSFIVNVYQIFVTGISETLWATPALTVMPHLPLRAPIRFQPRLNMTALMTHRVIRFHKIVSHLPTQGVIRKITRSVIGQIFHVTLWRESPALWPGGPVFSIVHNSLLFINIFLHAFPFRLVLAFCDSLVWDPRQETPFFSAWVLGPS